MFPPARCISDIARSPSAGRQDRGKYEQIRDRDADCHNPEMRIAAPRTLIGCWRFTAGSSHRLLLILTGTGRSGTDRWPPRSPQKSPLAGAFGPRAVVSPGSGPRCWPRRCGPARHDDTHPLPHPTTRCSGSVTAGSCSASKTPLPSSCLPSDAWHFRLPGSQAVAVVGLLSLRRQRRLPRARLMIMTRRRTGCAPLPLA